MHTMISTILGKDLVDPESIDKERLDEILSYVSNEMNIPINDIETEKTRKYYIIIIPLRANSESVDMSNKHTKKLAEMDTVLRVSSDFLSLTVVRSQVSSTLRMVSYLLQGVGLVFFGIGLAQFSGLVMF